MQLKDALEAEIYGEEKVGVEPKATAVVQCKQTKVTLGAFIWEWMGWMTILFSFGCMPRMTHEKFHHTLGPLQVQQVFLADEPPFQPHYPENSEHSVLTLCF